MFQKRDADLPFRLHPCSTIYISSLHQSGEDESLYPYEAWILSKIIKALIRHHDMKILDSSRSGRPSAPRMVATSHNLTSLYFTSYSIIRTFCKSTFQYQLDISFI